MKKWENFSDEQLALFVSKSFSFHQLAEKCGYQKGSGSGIAAVKKMCQEKSFDTTHFSNKLRKEDVKIEDIFIQGYKSRETLRKNLIALKGHQCECCGLSEWNNKEIPLQVHHIDGNGLNNLLSNIQLLCPNCHAQTDNYCGKNKAKNISDKQFIDALKESENIHQALIKIGSTDGRLYERAYKLLSQEGVSLKEKEKVKNKCPLCGEEISHNANYCIKCFHFLQQKSERPSREELKRLIRDNSFSALGKKFGVSDNAIRKWCRNENLPTKSREIKQYSDIEWEFI